MKKNTILIVGLGVPSELTDSLVREGCDILRAEAPLQAAIILLRGDADVVLSVGDLDEHWNEFTDVALAAGKLVAVESWVTLPVALASRSNGNGNGNGNASSGANLATSSYANQNNATTANAFMQAFSGGLPENQGVQSIKQISGDADTGYSVVTDRVSTVRNTTDYTVDGTGNATAGASTDAVLN